MQWKRPDKRKLVIEALKEAGREDLIGHGPNCLVRPDYSPAKRKPKADGEKGDKPKTKKPAAKKAEEKPEPKKPVSKKGWAKAKPKKNARPGKKK